MKTLLLNSQEMKEIRDKKVAEIKNGDRRGARFKGKLGG